MDCQICSATPPVESSAIEGLREILERCPAAERAHFELILENTLRLLQAVACSEEHDRSR